MRILRRTETHGSILPSAFGAIAAIPPEYLHHEEHGLRHPQSAYGTSMRLIIEQWTKTFDDLATLRTRYFLSQEDDLLKEVANSYAALLHRLNEHFDACYSVLRSMSSPKSSKQNHVHSQYLDQVGLVGWKQFKSSTRTYRESHLGLIVNAMKHSQGELCPIYFHSDKDFRPGFYLRGLLPGGALGPDPRLHRGGNSAISFARDMLMHIWWLYRTSDLLTVALVSYLNATHKYRLAPVQIKQSEAKWADIVRNCALISPEFFPDEWGLPYPRVVYAPSPEQLSIEFPSSAGSHRLAGDLNVRVLTTVDGAHRTEKLPYFGQDAVNTEGTFQRRC